MSGTGEKITRITLTFIYLFVSQNTYQKNVRDIPSRCRSCVSQAWMIIIYDGQCRWLWKWDIQRVNRLLREFEICDWTAFLSETRLPMVDADHCCNNRKEILSLYNHLMMSICDLHRHTRLMDNLNLPNRPTPQIVLEISVCVLVA